MPRIDIAAVLGREHRRCLVERLCATDVTSAPEAVILNHRIAWAQQAHERRSMERIARIIAQRGRGVFLPPSASPRFIYATDGYDPNPTTEG